MNTPACRKNYTQVIFLPPNTRTFVKDRLFFRGLQRLEFYFFKPDCFMNTINISSET